MQPHLETALPPQRYGGRNKDLRVHVSALAHRPLEVLHLWEGRKGCSASPDTGQQEVRDPMGSHYI